MYKIFITLFLIIYCSPTFSANLNTDNQIEAQGVYSYAYIRVEGKFLSKKLKVNVDLGDSDEQIRAGDLLSEVLTNKKSYAAVLNYIADLGYELVNTLDLTTNYNGSGGTSGIVYVMKKLVE